MANLDIPSGFTSPKPIKGQGAFRVITRTAAAEIFKGDPCTEGIDGTVTREANAAVATPADVDFIAIDHVAASASGRFLDPRECSWEIQVDDNGIITDLRGEDLASPRLTVEVGDRQIVGLQRTYASGQGLTVLVGSSVPPDRHPWSRTPR